MITCPTPGCDGVLRKVEGFHSPGDANVVFGPGRDEVHVLCPKCRKLLCACWFCTMALIRWPIPQPPGKAA